MKTLLILIMLVTAPAYLCSGERQIEYKIVDMSVKVPEANIPAKYYYDVAINAYINNIPLWVADKLIRNETGYHNVQSRAINKDGSRDHGIMQISGKNLVAFAKDYNDGKPINPYDTKTNIKVGLAFLGDMIEETGSLYGGVCAYNCGAPRVLKNKIPESTQKYAKRILG